MNERIHLNPHIQAIANDAVSRDREARQRSRLDYQRLAVWMTVLIGCGAFWALVIGAAVAWVR